MNILDIYKILGNFEVLLLRRCFYSFLRIQLILRCFYSRGASARQTGRSVKGAPIQSMLMFKSIVEECTHHFLPGVKNLPSKNVLTIFLPGIKNLPSKSLRPSREASLSLCEGTAIAYLYL